MAWLRKHILEALATGYVLIALWGGLVPFDLSFGAVPSWTPTWLGLAVEASHWSDIASNIALFIPLGLLVRAALWKRGWWPSASLIVSVGMSAAISYAIEFAQWYSPTRISSVADFGANLVGGLIGAVSVTFVGTVGIAFHYAVMSFVRRWRDSVLERPSGVLAQLCAAAILLFAAAPFDITFSPNLLYASVSDSNLVPFAMDARLSSTIVSKSGEVDARSPSRRLNDRWQRNLDYPMTVAGYALLAVLICHYLRHHCRLVGRVRAMWTLEACGLLALFASGSQLFVVSRSFDVTDILLALVGAGVGIMFADRVSGVWSTFNDDDSDETTPRVKLLRVACLGLLAVVIARELTPFDFDFSAKHIVGQLGQAELIPLQMYQTSRLPLAVEDMLAKFGRFALLGGLFVAWRSFGAFDRNMGRVGAAALGCGVLIAFLEACQVFLSARTPSVTDVLLATGGVASGIVMLRVLVSVREGIESEARARWSQPMFNVSFDESGEGPVEGQTTSDSTVGLGR